MSKQTELAQLADVVTVSSGNVGIGTSSPTNPLSVYHATTNVVGMIESGDAGAYLGFKDNTTTSYSAMYLGVTGNDMQFVTSATERMRIDSGGRVTMPYQPAFYASFSGDGTIGNMDVVYATYTNVGNHFNTSSGAFTVPVDGVYLFNADVMTAASGGTTYGGFYFLVNGANSGSLHHSHSNTSEGYRNTSGSAVLSLSANDVVRIKTYGSPSYGASSSNNWSGFSGYLLG